MSLYKNKYRIESARLQSWDYSSPGYYFITVCTHNRLNLFGDIINNVMDLNEFGRIVLAEWHKSFDIRHELLHEDFVVMPNHFHGIVRIVEASGRTSLLNSRNNPKSQQKKQSPRLPPKSISSFMAGIKSAITKRINKIRNAPGAKVFQQRFYDHIIRNEQELNDIRQYIKNNPENWHIDRFNHDSTNFVMESVEASSGTSLRD